MKSIITSLTGGLVEKVRPDLLDDSNVQSCVNMMVDEMGILSPVNDFTTLSDFNSYDYVWLWRMYRKPYVYNGTAIVESPYNYVYLCYKSSTNKLEMLGYYGTGVSKTATSQFKTGDSTYSTISITVAQKPSLAITNIRCTIVDGVSGNNARYIEIDESNNVVVGYVVSTELPSQVITYSQKIVAQDRGIGVQSGHFFGYRITFTDKFGAEGKPSPLIYDNTRFSEGKTQQVYSGFESSGNLISVAERFILNNKIDVGDIPIDVEFVNFYRSLAKHTQGFIPPLPLKFIGSVNAKAISSSYTDTFKDDGSGKDVSVDVLQKLTGDDLALSGNLILVSGTKNDIFFPISYDRYAKIIISNKNDRNYINCVIKIPCANFAPTDLGDILNKGFRFYMNDLITPIPCGFEIKDDYFHLRIPILYANMDNVIYLAYYPKPLAPVSYPAKFKTYLSGYPFELTDNNLEDFYNETGQRFVNRYNITDENDVIVLGGDYLDNGASFGSAEPSSTGITIDKPVSPDYVHKYYGIKDYPQNNIVLTGTEYIKIHTGILENNTAIPYTIYGFFNAFTTSTDGTFIFYDNDGDYSVGIRYRYIYPDIVFSFMVNNSSPGGFANVSLESGKDPHFFIYCSIDKKSVEVTCYIKNIETGNEVYYNGSMGTIIETGDVPSREFYVHGDAILPPSDDYLKFSDLHFHDGLYLSDLTAIKNICNSGNIFDTEFIGFDGSSLKNITIEDAKSVTETPSQGLIRWSDARGLTFPTLNELVVGRKVIKIVPRLGSKDSYESIVDVYTENGIYILSIDKLSSSTNLMPLTGESGTFVLQNKDSLVTVDSSNYFISNNTLYRQTGESFTDLSSGIIDIDCDKITYFPEYKAIAIAKDDSSIVTMYDIEKNIYFKQIMKELTTFADINEEGNRIAVFTTTSKKLSSALVDDGMTVKSKRFYVGLASLIRFNIEFEGKKINEGNKFSIRTFLKGNSYTKTFGGSIGMIDVDIDSNKWYHFPNGLICEYFELEFFNYTGIKKIEIEYRPRGRR